MTESTSTRFPKLDDSNYGQWSVMMEAELVRKGLWGLIEVVVDKEDKEESAWKAELEKALAKRSASKMAEARSEMILRVEGSQLAHMRSRDPRQVWDSLRMVHRARGFATSLALRRSFLTARKKTTQRMVAWIGEINSRAFEMEEIGLAVTEQDKILALTMGLPDSFKPVIISFDATPADQLTYEDVIVRLLNDEARQDAEASGRRTAPKVSADEAMAADRADITCFFCDKKGHYKSDCPEKQKWDELKKGKGTQTGTAMAADEVDDEEDGVW